MKLKQIIFALVAILSSFSVSAWAQTTVTTAAELKEALANGGEVTLGTDITVDETQTIPAGVSVTLDLNGKTVSQSKACVASYEMILNKGNLTIKNGTIRFTDTSEGDPTFGWGSYTVRNEGTLVVEDDATIEHLGKQDFATHMICAIFQYSGSTTINGGKISTPKYRSIRLWKGDMTINGGTFDGQFWVQAVDNSAKLTINAGTFEPNGNDASSVFVGNEKYDVEFAVAGGTFNGKIGCSDATKLAGAISGGKFTEKAKNATNSALLASGFIFGEAGTDGYYAVEDAPATHYIATLEDLKALRDAVNSGTNYYAGVNVYLTADIDLAGENWVGIGSATAKHGFMGNFDGNGYKIKNLTITDPALDSDGYAYAGLFAVTEGTDKNNQNTIKNLTIENVTINTTGHIVSAAIAYPYYTIVDNVKVCGNIEIQGGDYTAGVLAYTRRCVNASNLSIVGNDGSYVNGKQTVGGVISDIQMNGGLTAVYSNFSAEGITVTGEKSVGGIAGIIATQTLNGATVKNVALECSDARVGIVAGSLGGPSTISNVVSENVTGATAVIGATYDGAKAVEARIGNMYYATFAAAYTAAQAGETVSMLVDLNMSEILVLDKAITLDGNGKTLTSTAGRAINVSGADGVTIKNLTINASGERAINIIQNATNVTIDNVTATAANYTVNVASSAPNAKVAINNSSLTGLNVVNVASPGADVTITNGTITCNDQNASENYAALVLHKDGKNATIAATGVTFDIKGDSKKASNGAVGGVITIDGKTDEVDVVVAYISYGDNSYTFTSIEDAIAAAKEGEIITMLAPVVIAAGETLTLDKNITIAYTSNVAGEDMFTNRGTLNISAGTITYVNTDATGSNVTVSTISCEPGSKLNITGGVIENKTVKKDASSIYSYAIDMLTNGSLGDVTATIAGGTIYSDYMAIRQFNNGDACKNTLNITGGYIYGAKRAVQVHFKNNAAYTTISGGKIEAGAADGYSLCFLTTSENLSVSGGEFVGAVWYSGSKGFISGGTFASEIDAAYCAEGFACQQNADGTFGIVKANAGLSGDGTEASPYLINNVADLVLFRNSVNAGETKYSAPGVWVALAADIDLAGENWVGIGSATAEHGFMGNFNGNGYKIKNLTITDPALDSDGYAYAGLFAVTEGTDKNNQNTIKNLTIENVTINTTGHIVSAAIAYPYYTIVDNIKVCGDININGGNYTAGVLAYTRRCVNASNLAITGNDGSSVKGSQTVGGVISDIQMNGGLVADYKKFSAEGLAITGAMHVGGISGIISGQTLTGATVKNVNLTCSDARVGLVAGSLGDASAISVVETENVTGATALIGAGYKSAKAVEAKIGDKYFTTLEDALAAEGNEVELLVPYVVAADDEIVLDLKGKTVTGTPSEAKAYSAITNNGNLTIINGTLLCNHTLTGSTGYAVNTITNCGILTIDGATIQNTSTASNQIGYAIDNNSTSTNAIVTINSGNVVASGSNYYDGIRQFCNSLTKDNSVIVKGGEVSSIWMQNPSDGAEKNTKDVKGSISISGGTVKILSLEPSTNFQAAVTGGHVGDISYFQLAEGRNLVKFITGGTFGMDVTKFCADYHNCTSNENGVYEVKPDANYIAEYIIDDAKGENYTSAEKKVVGTLTYKRTLPNVEKWNPLYVPFAIPMSKLIENYDVAYFNDVRGNDANNDNVVDDGTLKMELVMIDNPDVTLNANYPFVFRAKTEEAKNLELVLDNATLYENTENSVVFTSLDIKCEVKGSYSKCKTGDNQYIVNTNGLWSPLNQDYDLKPYRLILTLSSNNNLKPFAARDIRMFLIGEEAEDGTTHIFDVENDAQTQNSIYDLQGRRVLTPQKGGLYIVNGKKTVMR